MLKRFFLNPLVRRWLEPIGILIMGTAGFADGLANVSIEALVHLFTLSWGEAAANFLVLFFGVSVCLGTWTLGLAIQKWGNIGAKLLQQNIAYSIAMLSVAGFDCGWNLTVGVNFHWQWSLMFLVPLLAPFFFVALVGESICYSVIEDWYSKPKSYTHLKKMYSIGKLLWGLLVSMMPYVFVVKLLNLEAYGITSVFWHSFSYCIYCIGLSPIVDHARERWPIGTKRIAAWGVTVLVVLIIVKPF